MPSSPTPSSPAAAEFGRRVRARREELGLSLERLAERTSMHWSYIGQCERGRSNVTLNTILKLAHALDVDPGSLITGLATESSIDT